MRSRHKARGGAVESVERFCVSVWFTGHLAAAVTLGTLIANDHQDLAAGQRPTVSQPDAGPDAADRAF
ncbi:hypothetical protein [Streptomyces glomeratus]|uniref:Tn3 transposase DDE domain-containing protein n=1 Tax=Streptomyces glomeratus TaxID=284452 RepID=A0ABP6M4Z8_9ACTN|nr:hypothetical protein [Streptomyces glomeratus]MCF1510393.1 hypothetical protein [Streptomyces glomeratus]